MVEAPGSKTFLGWDTSRRQAVMSPEQQRELESVGSIGRFAVDINRNLDEFRRVHNGLSGRDLPDPLTMAIALDPSIVLDHRARGRRSAVPADAARRMPVVRLTSARWSG